MSINELGYVLLSSSRFDDWRRYAEQVLGFMCSTREDGALVFRMDDRDCRILVQEGETEDLIAIGWMVESPEALDIIRTKAQEAGYTVEDGTSEECRTRRITGFIAIEDPLGVRHEVAWGPVLNYNELFHPPVPVSGFVTGEQGLGHIVLAASPPLFSAEEEFLSKALGFRIANMRRQSIVKDRQAIRINWYHCENSRHHSMAIAEAELLHPIQHIMIEVRGMDDVGRAFDRAEANDVVFASTLGRHVNDGAFSFYSVTPSGFWIEYGYVDPRQEVPLLPYDDGAKGSLWGHRFLIPIAPKKTG